MKRSEFGKLVNLAKNSLAHEKLFGEELVLDAALPSLAKEGIKGSLYDERNSPRPLFIKEGELTKEESQYMTLNEYQKKISNCKKCPLGKTRINFVFGVGNPKAELMFVGEGPGFDEDHKGEPFVGRAGQLLTKIIEAMGLSREKVYIANTVKCHPMVDPSNPEKRSNDRPPTTEEILECLPYLEKQIDIIRPKFICCLGTWAARTLLASEEPIGKLRGRFYDYHGIQLLATYHPAALLRNPAFKKDVWEDMKKIIAAMK